jgi:heterodisulfide reductase subunit A-like polyferredoxin
MQASLDLADQGYRVYMAERKSAIGGHMAQLDKTFPTNDCAMCTISPKLVDVGRHRNIELLTNTEVVSVEGQVGNFSVTLRRQPRYIDPLKCISCGDCEEVCPVEIPDPFNEGLSPRRAAYKLYPQAVPNAYAIDKLGTAPCRTACPAGQRAQGYIALIAEGRYKEAYRVIKEDNPFPSVCGRTCHHPCESYCARTHVDEPVGIMALKRFVMDYALAYGRDKVEAAPRTRPEWVAVVGSGPAGLTAAHDLVKMGYGVTVFEALPVAGGMMRVGIPAHRLPKGVLQQDIDDILALGVVLKTNSPIRDPLQLLEQGYDAVCVATGISTRDHLLGIEGEHAEGVISAATYLRKINLGEPVHLGKRVAVVGGGITALDAAAVARRLGAEEVIVALDRPRGELPAYQWEMEAVEAEGIQLYEHCTATRIITTSGSVSGVELALIGKGMTVDADGRRRPTIVAGSEFTLETDTVIGTVGQQSDLTFLDPSYDDLTGDSKTLASEYPGLFIVGGRKTGASYIVEAVGLGHRVATSIHHYLQKMPSEMVVDDTPPPVKVDRAELAERVRLGEIKLQPRQKAASIPMDERVISFREVVLPLTERQARAEAQRCLQCGVCAECLACVYACGVDAIQHNMVEQEEQLQVGAVILAPGYQAYSAERSGEFGLGRYPNVVTALQLERMLSASGPTGGQVHRPSDEKIPRKVAFLQCVGSRDQSHDYCSAVCCMYATKEALLIKEHHPETEVEIFTMDVRAFSKGYDAYYQRAQEQHGIRYTRCRISELREESESGNLLLRFLSEQASGIGDQESGLIPVPQSPISEEIFDLVVLSVGMEISESVQRLAQNLELEIDEHGFCRTVPFQPVQTSRAGMFAVGPFREPKDIPESVVDASGAAGVAAGLLSPVRGSLAREVEYPAERDVAEEPPRVGVFVCHCGSNIAGFLDVEQVTAYASTLPHVAHASDLLYACSQDNTALIQEGIKEHKLNRVVVASCSPLTHGPLFQDCLRQSGLNEHLLTMANIRNHCSWVHSNDADVATAKAKDLVRMATARGASLEPLKRWSVPVQQSALVVGGGPAGMNAALTLAQQGYPVHLVEREHALGGNLRRLFFDLDPEAAAEPQTYLAELASEVSEHPNITVHLGAQIGQTRGFMGNFESLIQHENGKAESLDHGVTIVAVGGQEYRGPEYGYGSHPRILTQQQMEAWLAGDESRQIPKPDEIQQLVMIQCVGPAETTCTRTCCAVALKNALRFRSQNPQSQVIILYRDIRTYGFLERLYQQARAQGVLFVRYQQTEKPVVKATDPEAPLRVKAKDLSLGVTLALDPDLLILSMPMVPAEGSCELATRFKVPVDMQGWFLEAHVKLRPVEFASEGIFVAGAAHYPKLLEETIVQAQAAASRAATILSRETLAAKGAVAQVDTQLCVGCLTCLRACPYGVPVIETELWGVGGIVGAAYIEPTICQGCGTCVAECPAEAIELLHYRHRQVERQALALFEEPLSKVKAGDD